MSDHDLTVDGLPWEIKQIEGSESVFAGKGGNRYSWNIRKKLADYAAEVADLYGFTETWLIRDDCSLTPEEWAQLQFYLDTIVPNMIWDGEIGRYAIDHSMQAGWVVAADLLLSCDLHPGNHEYIKSPCSILTDWKNCCRASDIFAHVVGVFIVSETKGWARIQAHELDKFLEFRTISKGQVKIGVRMWPEGHMYTTSSTPNSDIISEVLPILPLSQLELLDPKRKSGPEGVRARKFVNKFKWYVLDSKIRRVKRRKRSEASMPWSIGTSSRASPSKVTTTF